MSFQGAPAAQEGPPGIPAVAVATTDINQLIHIIQAQQAAQQVHQQQMAAMLNHLVTMQNANLPPIGGTGIGATRNIDERPFRRIQQFDNKSKSWKEWRVHFLAAVRESSPLTAQVIEMVELNEVPVQPDKVVEKDPSYQEAVGLRHSLHSRLVSLTTGVSFAIVESSGDCGLEAWKLLSQK